MRLSFSPTAFLAALVLAVPASASTYTVSPAGSDRNNGITAPFRTLQRAMNALRDGDTLLLKPGTYPAGIWIEGRRNITLRGLGSVVLDGSGARRQDVLAFDRSRNVTLENLKLRSARRSGLFVARSRGLTVRGVEVSRNGGAGILTGNTSDVLIENSTAAHNGTHGIYLSQSGDRLRVVGNRILHNRDSGIQINAVQPDTDPADPENDSLSRDCVIARNTIAANGRGGGAAINLMGVRHSHIKENTIRSNLAGGIALWDDGAGSRFGSRDNVLLRNTIHFEPGRGRYGVQVLRGSTGNQVLRNTIVSGKGPAIQAEERIRSEHNVTRRSG